MRADHRPPAPRPRSVEPVPRGGRRARPPAARAHGSRVPRDPRRDDGAPAHRVPHRERADAPDQRHRLGRHGDVLRQPARAGRHRDRRRQRRVRRPHVRGGAPLRRRGRAHRSGVGRRRSTRSGCSTRSASTRTPASSRSCTRRRRPASRTTSRRLPRSATPTRCFVRRHRHVARRASRSRSTAGASTPRYSGTQKCLGVPPGLSPVTFSDRAVDARRRTARSPPQSWYLDLSLIANYVVGLGARVPPHRAGRDGVRAARRARRGARRGPRGRVGPPPRGRQRLQARAARARLPPGRRRAATGSPSSPPRGCPTAPTTRRCARRCSTTYGIEVGGGLGRVRGQGLAHRAHGPLRPRALGDHAARRAPRAALTLSPASAAGATQHVLAVVAQLGDRLAHVGERAVRLRLARPLLVDLGVPAAAQLLEARHVDAAVVQVAGRARGAGGRGSGGRRRSSCRTAARRRRRARAPARSRAPARRRRRATASTPRSRRAAPTSCASCARSRPSRRARRAAGARRGRCRRRAARARRR